MQLHTVASGGSTISWPFLLLTNALGIVMMNLISAHGIQIQVGLDNKGVVSASPRNCGQRCHCLHRMHVSDIWTRARPITVVFMPAKALKFCSTGAEMKKIT